MNSNGQQPRKPAWQQPRDDGMAPAIGRAPVAPPVLDDSWLRDLDKQFAVVDEVELASRAVASDDQGPAEPAVGSEQASPVATVATAQQPITSCSGAASDVRVDGELVADGAVATPASASAPPRPWQPLALSAPLVAIAREHGVRDRDLLKLERFVRAIVVDGKPIVAAARLVGWSQVKAWQVVNESSAYEAMRAEVLSRYTRTTDQLHGEIFNVVADTAIVGAHRQNAIVRESTNDGMVHAVAEAAMNRIGARAPDRAEVRHQVELSEASAGLIRKALTDVKLARATIDLERDFGFATAKPELDESRAARAVGSYQPDDDPSPDAS